MWLNCSFINHIIKETFTVDNPFNVMQYISSESIRQSAPVKPMLYAYARVNNHNEEITELFILSLANCFWFDGYRTTPVTFGEGGHATAAHNIPGAMERLVSCVPDREDFTGWYRWIHAFLKIHPFQDGNGRIASLLFNWGMNTLDEPIPLPYYKF